MKITSIHVDGFRRFSGQVVRLEEETTVIAGANNSGKTSIIDLLASIFGQGANLTVEDLNAGVRSKWIRAIIDSASKSDDELAELIESKSLQPTIEVKIDVGYSPDEDDIREFADYLMDLDPDKNSFHFVFTFAPPTNSATKIVGDIKRKIDNHRFTQGNTSPSVTDRYMSSEYRSLHSLVEAMIFDLYRVQVYFTDETHKHRIPMEKREFQNLFNFRAVKASRELDDVAGEKTRRLSGKLIEVARATEEWQSAAGNLPDLIFDAIDGSDVKELTQKAGLEGLNSVLESISQTNGASQSEILLDFLVSDGDILSLVSRAMQARYLDEGVALGESSQGLGYSNLIYLHLETEAFLARADSTEGNLRVNLLVLEEPESHMHPQMQNAFIRHLFSRIGKSRATQSLVTTHSGEIVRSTNIRSLRSLKVSKEGCRFIDLRRFHEENVVQMDPDLRRLFDLLYQINFAYVLFADKVILYEGDTERMYIRALIEQIQEYATLSTQYVSYVQVGGAYAHVYKPLIVDTLQIKTVIITDIDYMKNPVASSPAEIEALGTTNATLNKIFWTNEGSNKTDPTIGQLYRHISPDTGLAHPDPEASFAISFQGPNEGHARTFEEAVLAAVTGQQIWESTSHDDWLSVRDKTKLKFSLARGSANHTIREVVDSTSSNKTDFTYSLILSEKFAETVPKYIRSSLLWLAS